LLPFFQMGYVTGFYDTGLLCPYVVSISTSVPVAKYGSGEQQKKILSKLTQKEGAWQGATWFTEIKGGSDMAANTDTIASKTEDGWRLNGEKYFCSNIGAEVAIVTARLENGEDGIKGLQLFLVPRYRKDGSLNYLIRRIKNKIGTRSVPTGEVGFENAEAIVINEEIPGIYLIMEALNISRVANAIGSVSLAQRAISEAYNFATQREAFGSKIADLPLLKWEFGKRLEELHAASQLAWKSAELLNKVWEEKPPYSENYHYFRFITHMAKYWCAEVAVKHAKWSMEIFGGLGILEEFKVERLLREAIILPIWEGTPHRQILDGWEVMARYNLHERLFDELEAISPNSGSNIMHNKIQNLLRQSKEEQETSAGKIFRQLARTTANALAFKVTETVI